MLSYKGSEVWTGGLGRVFDSDKTDLSDYNAVSMWVKPDGNGQKMVIQINDSYEAYLTEFVKGTKAQYVTIPFTSFRKKGSADESADPGNITSFKLWCNSVPENYNGQKEENGNYVAEGTILFDDMKAVKISDADLAKVNEQGLIISDTALTDLTGQKPGEPGQKPGGDSGQKPGDSDQKPGDSGQKPGETVTAPGKISFTSVKKAPKSAQKAVLKWKKASGATGYQIYMKTGKKGKYKLVKTVKKKNTTRYTTKKLKKNTKYYFKVRSYKTISGTTAYGKYSKVKSITIK